MTGLIWDAVAVIFAVLCLLIVIALTFIAIIFCYAVIKAIKELAKKKGKVNKHDTGND